MLDLDELKEMHDKAYNQGMVTRERASDDLVFYWVTNWDDNLLGEAQLQYRGEFNIVRKAGRQIQADLRANPVQVQFDPKDPDREDGADLLDGLYMSDDRVNTSLESYDNASLEAIVCGVGAWELYTEYESNAVGNENQVIRRRPVYEANNNCFWDPNAKRLDKSDADYVSILRAYSHEAYEELVEELTGEEPEANYMDSFKNPEESYTFPWAAGENEHIYVTCFYHRKKEKEKILFLTDPFGQEMALRESDLEDVMDEMIESGFEIDEDRTKEVERWKITKYIASGSQILATYDIAGDNIPVVPTYGERAFVEGEEHYEGVTRLAKDPQRLRNFQMSYLADIVSRSPRPKAIFNPEQIQGFEFMYEENGADNNYPYLLQNRTTAGGEPLPVGPVAQMPEQPIPQSLMASIDLTRQAVEDVANPGLPQDIADPDLSGKAVMALQARLDQQSIVYQQNLKHAKRRDGEIYAGMAAVIYDAPRTATVTSADGTRSKVQMMQAVQDRETGQIKVLNDLTNAEFDVYADVGPSYSTQREQTIDQLGAIAASFAQTDPNMHKIITLEQLTLMDGVATQSIRDYANKQLVLLGVREPETEEEMMALQQAQQNQQPDAGLLLAQAEMQKAAADQMREQRLALLDQAKIQNDQAKIQVDQFKAQTDRFGVQVDAEKVGADIQFTRTKTVGQQIDNTVKAISPLRASVSQAAQ